MGTLLENIQATPEVLLRLLENREENNKKAIELIDKTVKKDFKEIIIVGSGSSLNEIRAAKGFVEKVTKKRVTAETSNDFLYNHVVFDTDNLYIFMSQSGTSETTRRAQLKLKKLGCTTIAVSSNTKTFIAVESGAVVDSMAAHEEYTCVTMGYCASLIALELLGLSIAEYLGTVTKEQVQELGEDLKKATAHYDDLITMTENWFKKNVKDIMKAQYYAVYGCDDLWGVALEGALKILEIPNSFAVGYELEDGMHGPNLGFDERICLLVLNDGERENERALSLGRMVKEEYNCGYILGKEVLDDTDLKFNPTSKYFKNVEFACVLQTICWFMSVEKGIDLTKGHSGKRYYYTHTQIDLE